MTVTKAEQELIERIAETIDFAAPIELAVKILSLIKEDGYVKHYGDLANRYGIKRELPKECETHGVKNCPSCIKLKPLSLTGRRR